MALILDSGALIAIDHRDRKLGAMLRIAQQERLPVRTSAAALAQVWRKGARQVNLARSIAGMDVAAIEETSSKRIGELLGRTRTADVVDAHVVLLATSAADHVLTSDVDDLGPLFHSRGMAATLIHV